MSYLRVKIRAKNLDNAGVPDLCGWLGKFLVHHPLPIRLGERVAIREGCAVTSMMMMMGVGGQGVVAISDIHCTTNRMHAAHWRCL
jgi:hypothetical protein